MNRSAVPTLEPSRGGEPYTDAREGAESCAEHASQRQNKRQRRLLVLLLLLVFVRGLLYLAVLPPWQHYDEPTHFEYVKLIVERLRIPQTGDYDLEMRREIAASMKAHGYFRTLGEPVIDLWSNEPPGIGIAELNHPPLYYMLAAVPQFLVQAQDVETQLYVARLTSVLLYVLIVASAYGLARDLMPSKRWLPLIIAAFIAMLPPFTDLMSAVNNDVGAVASVSLMLWAGVRLLHFGPSVKRVVVVLLLAGACVLTKSTATVAAVTILVVLAVGLIPSAYRRWLWIGLALASVGILALAITFGEHAASWYSVSPAAGPNRVTISTPLGKYALGLSARGTPNASRVLQELEHSRGQDVRGRPMTLGFWLKGEQGIDQPAVISLREGEHQHIYKAEVTTEWQFHSLEAKVGADAEGLAVAIRMPSGAQEGKMVYVDGLVLVEGQRPAAKPPQFETDQAIRGEWGGEAFENLLRNGSAERSWPGMRSWIGNTNMYRQPMAMVFHSILDWSRTKWVYWGEVLRLNDSFWGRFSWGHLSLPQAWFYVLRLLTVAAAAGCILALVRRKRSGPRMAPWQRHAWGLMGVLFVVSWGMAIVRIHPVFPTFNFIWPLARYAAVAIVPTATFLVLGWRALLPVRWRGWAAVGGLVGLATLDAVALFVLLLPFYYG